ncbi:MAG: phytanoyl-CoA dioxygenase family protein [Actinomycetota bacterium]
MRVSDHHLDALRERGYMIVDGFLTAAEVADARAALWEEFPSPEAYFADPAAHAQLQDGQFAGNRRGPWSSWVLNRLTFHPDLVDAVRRFLGSHDLRLYKTELWAKYSGGVDHDQVLHRDFSNHTLVVPKATDPARQMTSFLLLSDVDEGDGPTKVVPLADSAEVPYWPARLRAGELRDHEVSVTGPAGTLFSYRSDVLHRGSAITGHRRARFTLLADYEVWGPRWTGKCAWPDTANRPGWTELVERATPDERALFGFPRPGDPYWDEQTLGDVTLRYPGLDPRPYREAMR